MAWCAGQKYTTDAVAGDEENAEFYRVLRTQLLGDTPLHSPSTSSPSSTIRATTEIKTTSLEFMFLDLSKMKMQMLLEALYYHQSVHTIKRILFHGCRIRNQDALELLIQLFHVYTHWTHVEVSCLCQVLDNEQSRLLIMEIMKSKNLEHLNISSVGISDGLILWRDMLSCPSSANPSSIVVRSSTINFEHTQEFLSHYPISNGKQNALRHLDLSACQLDDSDMSIIVAALRTMNIQLESLALKGNRLSQKSFPILANLIQNHQGLRSLDLSMNTRLFTCEDEFAVMNIEKFLNVAIPDENNSGTLERLVLSKTNVGESAAIMMIRATENNCVLQELDLSFCLIGESVMEQLVTSLPRMKAMKQLFLHGFHFNERNAAANPHNQRQALWKAIQENTSLVQLQGLSMFLGAGRPELASVILGHLSERNRALHQARTFLYSPKYPMIHHYSFKEENMRRLLPSCLWSTCLEKLGTGNWTASAVYMFLHRIYSTMDKE